MAEKELVLKLGVEGGGAAIYRTSLPPSGTWQFHVEGSSMYLDENDDEDWRHWTNEPVQTIQEALRSVAKDGSWVFYYPVSVHPEYRTLVWEQVQEIVRKLPKERSERWQHRSYAWQHLFQKPE